MNSFPLDTLAKGQHATILHIAPNPEFGSLDNIVTQRLNDLGFCAGTQIEIIARGIFGIGPYAVRLGNQSQFSLRRAEAQKIVCHTTEAA